MRLAIVGSRTITDMNVLIDALQEYDITEIVSGGARGVDTMAEDYAVANDIDTIIFPADWERYGKRAGYLRNVQIVDYADEVLALWDGKSRGTKHTIDIAHRAGKPVTIVTITVLHSSLDKGQQGVIGL